MHREDFIGDALQQPRAYIAYSVSSRLAARFPGRAILEGSDWDFSVRDMVRAGECSLVNDPSVHSQSEASWERAARSVREEPRNAWMNVLWRGHLVDVLVIAVDDETSHHWIVADAPDVARDFYRAVCECHTTVRGEILVFERGSWRKDEALYAAVKGATFDDVILPESLESEIRGDMARFMASRELYERHRIPWKRGALLTGPPGNGKTQTVKALANEMKVPVLYVRSFVSRYDTVPDNVRAVFERARATTPCMLVFEDVDAMIEEKHRATFLNELDGFDSNTGVVTVATTNHPERLDPALLDRPSRFDRTYAFGPPGANERERYARRWNETLEEAVRLSEAGVAAIVELAEGFSFAYMKELFLSSLMVWVQDPRPGRMDEVTAERCGILRAQADAAAQASSPAEEEDDDDGDD